MWQNKRIYFIIFPIGLLLLMLVFTLIREYKIDNYYRNNAKITKEYAIQIASKFIRENLSEDPVKYLQNIDIPDYVKDSAREWTVSYAKKGRFELPGLIAVKIDKVSGKAKFVLLK